MRPARLWPLLGILPLLACHESAPTLKFDGGDWLCVSGNCWPTSCGDQACPHGQGCINGNTCDFPQCIGVRCTSDQLCARGDCYQKNCQFSDCPDGSVCAAPCGDPLACNPRCTDLLCVRVSCVETETCLAGLCVPPTCSDGLLDGDETDVDCGGGGADAGSDCPRCAVGKRCNKVSDCGAAADGGLGPACIGGRCASIGCSDHAKDGDETDVDCGGSCPVKCGTNSTCKQGSDCASGVCDGKDKVCNAASCRDGVANGDETDTDCGGEFCFKCANGKKCKVADDCASGICTALVCAHP